MHCQALHALALLLCVLAVAQCSQYCPNGDDWYHHSGRCYHWVTQTEGWFGAEMNCREHGGQLVSINSASENRFLHAMANCSNTFWIGMAKTDVRKRGFRWWDGSHDNYTELSYNNPTAHYDCVSFQGTGSWSNTYCQSLLPSICATPALTARAASSNSTAVQESVEASAGIDGSGPETSLTPTSCPAGWLTLEGTCYFVSSDKVNYFNAQMSCQTKGATVASILSARQQTLLNMALGCGTQVWIGLEKVKPCLTDPSHATCWMWMDRQPFDFNIWVSGHPSSSKDVECAYSDGQWRGTNCYNEYRYICKK